MKFYKKKIQKNQFEFKKVYTCLCFDALSYLYITLIGLRKLNYKELWA